MSNIKISEMAEAESLNDNDLLIIVQGGVNKKITKQKAIGDIIQAINNPTYTTTEGTDLSIDNTRVGKMKFEYYGDTEQETTTGKNKIGTLTDFVANDTSAINVTYNTEANTITVKHLTTSAWKGIYKTLTGLTAGATMTISVYATTTTSTGWSLSVRNSGGTVIDETTHNTSGTETHFTFTVPNDGSITIRAYAGYGDVAVNDTATYSKFQLEYGSSVTAYEPYTGGIASPNPDYPQEVKTVTGENTINIVGKNFFDIGNSLSTWFQTADNGIKVNYNIVNRTTATINGNKLTVNSYDNTGWTWISKWINLKPNTTYTISGTNTQGIKIVGFNSQEIASTGTLISTKAPNNTFITFNTGNYNYYALSLYPAGADNYIENIQIEIGSTATTYEAFKGQSYPINLSGKNYCDGILEAGGIATTTGVNEDLANRIRTKNMCKIPSGQITISVKETDLSVSIRCYDNSKAYLGVAFSGWETLPNTFTPLTNTQYIRFVFKKANDSSITVNSVTEIQVESGSTATPYEEFYQYQLCDIEGHQDYIHDNGGQWFKHKEVEKRILTGTENWSSASNNYPVFNVGIFTDKVSGQENFKCNNFSYLGNAQTTLLGYAMSFNTDIYSKFMYIQVPSSIVSQGDVATFKSWISSKNTEVYYPLATPIEEEITEPSLINQLNAIKYGAESYYGQTNIIITSEELQPTLKVQTLDKIGDKNE